MTSLDVVLEWTVHLLRALQVLMSPICYSLDRSTIKMATHMYSSFKMATRERSAKPCILLGCNCSSNNKLLSIMVPGFEAPVYIAWARANRSAVIWVSVNERNNFKSKRIEFRAPDPPSNPCLAFSAIVYT